MAYVFGVPVPLNEMLFILMVAQLGAIIAVLYEIRKLSRIIRIERQDLSRLESDISRMEQDEQRLEDDESRLRPRPVSRPEPSAPSPPRDPEQGNSY